MKTSTLMLALTIAPTIAMAQQSVQGSASASASAAASIPSSYSAESRARLEATFAAARERNLPEQPIRDRIAEGQAKAASEAQVVVAAQRAGARLEAAQSAMIRAGRSEPSQSEVARGFLAMERGATTAQIEAVASHTPSDRSLVVALDVLARLQAQGMSSEQAVSRIIARLDANASDRVLGDMALTTGAQANGSAALPGVRANAAGTVTGSATAGATGVATGAAAGVGVVIKPPQF